MITAIRRELLITKAAPLECIWSLTYNDMNKMRSFYIFIILMAHGHKVQSGSPCDSQFCVCRYNNKIGRDLFSETLDCSYDPKVLERQFILPETVYSLDLSWNNLTTIKSSGLLNSDTLLELLLSHNKITDIDFTKLHLPQLSKLDLNDNALEYLPKEAFQYLTKLEYLNLANNRFTSFENLMLHQLSNLNEIILDNNDLGASLDDNNLFDRSGFGLTHKIESLSISGINLNEVHENFFVDAYNLRRLDIASNNISDIFELPFTLEYLDLSNNPITEISGEDFADTVALKELKLNNLWIKEVPDFAFASLHALVSLEIERNINLTWFSATAFGQDVLEDPDDFALEKLSLRGSRLRSLDQKLEVPLGHLIHLDLQGNLWNCNCKIIWMKNLQIQPKDYDHIRCFTPRKLYNSRVFELDDEYFGCQNINNKFVGLAIVVVSSCLVLTAVAFWIFTMSPKLLSRCRCLRHLRMPTAEYSVLTNASTRMF